MIKKLEAALSESDGTPSFSRRAGFWVIVFTFGCIVWTGILLMAGVPEGAEVADYTVAEFEAFWGELRWLLLGLGVLPYGTNQLGKSGKANGTS